MIKGYIQKWLIVFSLMAAALGIVVACGGWYEEPENSSFTPETFLGSSPLFYSGNTQFYNTGFWDRDDYNSRFNDSIVADWHGYLKGDIEEEDLRYLLVNANRNEIDSLYEYYSKSDKNRIVNYWASKINLKSKKVESFIEFLFKAKKIEVNSITVSGTWSYNDYNQRSQIEDYVIEDLKKKYVDEKDPFLKNRYWFQTVKAFFYSSKWKKTISFFDETQSGIPHNLLYYRALNYVAGVNYHSKNYTKANYLYSLMFNECNSMAMDAAYGFHPQDDEDWKASLALAANNTEKAALWALFGYYADEKRAIQEIYNIAPDSRHLNFLLTRLINKEEKRWYNEMNDDAQPVQTREEYKVWMNELQDKEILTLIEPIAQSGKTHTPHLWYLAAGYIQLLNGNHFKATSFFDKVEKTTALSSLGRKQVRLLRFINTLGAMESINTKNEKIIYKDLKWLYEECAYADTGDMNVFRFQAASDWSKKYVALLYGDRNNGVMRELFNRTDQIYQTEEGIMAMRTFLMKPVKTEFETLALNIYSVSVNDIDEYRALRFAYSDKTEEAISILETLPVAYHPAFNANPFNGKIKDCNDCDHMAKQTVTYTRLTFLYKLRELKLNIAKKDDVYSNALLLGNAYYSISHYGNSRVNYGGNIIGGPYYSAEYIHDNNKRMLLDNSLSKLYYQMALNDAVTDEQKAKCWYLLAKCERNDYYNRTLYFSKGEDAYDPEAKDFESWEGFKMLKTEYSDTRYYQDVIGECGYFRTYLGRR